MLAIQASLNAFVIDSRLGSVSTKQSLLPTPLTRKISIRWRAEVGQRSCLLLIGILGMPFGIMMGPKSQVFRQNQTQQGYDLATIPNLLFRSYGVKTDSEFVFSMVARTFFKMFITAFQLGDRIALGTLSPLRTSTQTDVI